MATRRRIFNIDYRFMMILSLTILLFSSQAFAVGILWFGAHPDDEGAISAVMAKYCTSSGEPGKYPCRIVVATKGEGGNCKGLPPPEQCTDSQYTDPDHPNPQRVAAVRTEEMRNAALYLHSSLIQWGFTNQHHPGLWNEPIGRWSNEVQVIGGLNAIKTAIKNQILQFNPHVIITFDPRHGTTCHQEHRSIAALVTVSYDEMNIGFIPLLFVESALTDGKGANGETIWIGNKAIVDSDPAIFSDDASVFLPNYGDTAWQAAITEAQIHQSQNTVPELFPLLTNAPTSAQKVFFLQRSQVQANDSRYESICPVNYP